MRRHTSRTAVLLLVALFTIGAAGCASSTTGHQGSPFFDYNSEDLKASLKEFLKLEGEVKTHLLTWSLADVENHILTSSKVAREEKSLPEPLPERHATINMHGELITYTWRFAPISVKTLSIPVRSWRDASNVGFSFSATEYNGKLVEVKTGFVPMPESTVTDSTKDLILLGVGAGATLFLLP